MGGEGITVVDRALRFTLTNPAVVAELKALDTNGDGQITIDANGCYDDQAFSRFVLDQDCVSDASTLDRSLDRYPAGQRTGGLFGSLLTLIDQFRMRQRIVAAMADGGDLITVRQQAAMLDLFDTYNEAIAFNKFTDAMVQRRADCSGLWFLELEFEATDWPVIAAELDPTGQGRFTGKKLADLSARVYKNLVDMVGTYGTYENAALVAQNGNMPCGRPVVTELSIPSQYFPSDLLSTYQYLVDRFSVSTNWLYQYSEIECEQGDCPSRDEITLQAWQVPRMPAVNWTAKSELDVRQTTAVACKTDSNEMRYGSKW